MLIEEIDGSQPATHAMARWLVEAGFIAGALGFQATYPRTGSRHTSVGNPQAVTGVVVPFASDGPTTDDR
jgi:hypothetical protein